VFAVFVVDNTDEPAAAEAIARAAHAHDATVIALGANRGIGAAQNAGVAAAIAQGAQLVLLSDDDSVAPADLVARLATAFRALRADGERLAAVGPLVRDARDPSSTLVFVDTPRGPRRAPPRSHSDAPFPVAFLIASGCLVAADAWREIGPMREDLFIDHVDLEWGLRARRAGWSLYALPSVALDHHLGETVLHPWFLARRRVHLHAPVRNYYLARNTVLMMRGAAMPAGWPAGYALWLAKYAAFNVLFAPPRLLRARMILKGIADGLAGRTGPMGSAS
jgi:rhamnosyltransferase